jgi:hypothetical protein
MLCILPPLLLQFTGEGVAGLLAKRGRRAALLQALEEQEEEGGMEQPGEQQIGSSLRVVLVSPQACGDSAALQMSRT